MKTLLISDIHGNAEALRAVMEAEPDADATIFLGDALLSGPQANETLELLDRLKPAIAIRGNHDDEVLDPSTFRSWPAEWVALNEWILDHLDASAVPKIEAFTAAGFRKALLDRVAEHVVLVRIHPHGENAVSDLTGTAKTSRGNRGGVDGDNGCGKNRL